MKKMDKEKVKIILLGMITIILFCLLVVVSLNLKNDSKLNNSSNLESNKQNSSNKIDSSNKDNSSSNSTSSSVKEDKVDKNDTKQESSGNLDTSSSTTSSSSENSTSRNEEDVVSYFEDVSSKLDTYKKTGNTSLTADIKNGFITIVDFLFYDGYIKGYTFKEVSDEVKIKVLTLALKIDNKIDEYLPNYKETIKNKASNLKEKIAITYLEVTANICDRLGESSCNIARENFKDMKDSFGFTWEGIKSVALTSSSKLKEILNEWYQSIK